jgi:hypothetical protein
MLKESRFSLSIKVKNKTKKITDIHLDSDEIIIFLLRTNFKEKIINVKEPIRSSEIGTSKERKSSDTLGIILWIKLAGKK